MQKKLRKRHKKKRLIIPIRNIYKPWRKSNKNRNMDKQRINKEMRILKRNKNLKTSNKWLNKASQLNKETFRKVLILMTFKE